MGQAAPSSPSHQRNTLGWKARKITRGRSDGQDLLALSIHASRKSLLPFVVRTLASVRKVRWTSVVPSYPAMIHVALSSCMNKRANHFCPRTIEEFALQRRSKKVCRSRTCDVPKSLLPSVYGVGRGSRGRHDGPRSFLPTISVQVAPSVYDSVHSAS
ncbi:uncharacterized protein BDV14DRAFT_107944 [Aspergillus stella-maris]|uniref:uncharacterized protein n=1 Tax=Aspergillus stella-maris TaxID=1810926 RepID=UPI003CCE02E0